MESKETTARYYNLLPNKGHAVRITMKLYKKLIGPESVLFYVDSSTVNWFSGKLLVSLFVICVNNKLWSLCMIFEVVGIITFFLEIYQNVYIYVSYMLKYQRFDFSCKITERIYSKPLVITSFPEIFRYMWNSVSYIHTYQCLFIYWMFD